MVVLRNNYGLLISLIVHLLILAVPISMTISERFKEVELFVIDERPVQPMKEKIVNTTYKEMPEEIIKEVQPHTVVTEPEIKETHETKAIEPAIVSSNPDEVLMPTAPSTNKALLQPPAPTISETPEILNDVEFGSSIGPRFIHREVPVYPLIARRLGKEGRVLLRLTIDEKGILLDIEVVEGAGFGLTQAAIDAVKKSTFEPAKRDGRPVLSKALLPVKFTLRRME